MITKRLERLERVKGNKQPLVMVFRCNNDGTYEHEGRTISEKEKLELTHPDNLNIHVKPV